jgi:hypothetical protein
MKRRPSRVERQWSMRVTGLILSSLGVGIPGDRRVPRCGVAVRCVGHDTMGWAGVLRGEGPPPRLNFVDPPLPCPAGEGALVCGQAADTPIRSESFHVLCARGRPSLRSPN